MYVLPICMYVPCAFLGTESQFSEKAVSVIFPVQILIILITIAKVFFVNFL